MPRQNINLSVNFVVVTGHRFGKEKKKHSHKGSLCQEIKKLN